MQLFAYRGPDGPRLGLFSEGQPRDLETGLRTAGARAELVEAARSGDLLGFLAAAAGNPQAAVPRDGAPLAGPIAFLPPVRPSAVIGVGRNYGAHADEGGLERQEKPRLFVKLASSVIAHGDPIPRPAGVSKLDYEAELGVVIGRTAKRVPRADALSVVAGYLPLNDISAREFQFDVSPGQTSLAKSMDGFCPIGPVLLANTPDTDPAGFVVRAFLNDTKMQEGRTSDLIFDVPCLVEYVTRFVTLHPGDIIATGTPAGVGHFREPPVYLAPGDRIAVEIDGLPLLENTVVEGG